MEDAIKLKLLAPLAEAMNIQNQVEQAGGNPWSPDFAGPLETFADLTLPDKIREVLAFAEDATPAFLNGVLLNWSDYNKILRLMQTIEHDLERGAKHEHCANQSAKAGQAFIGEFLKRSLDAVAATE